MPDIPNQPVIGRVEDVMERDGELDDVPELVDEDGQNECPERRRDLGNPGR